MDFNEYQKQAASTAVYEGKGHELGLSYCALGLAGEAGEVANKVKKILRGDATMVDSAASVIGELGDCLWYLAEAANNLGCNLETIAADNLAKLADRKARGVVKGSGDNR